MRSLSSMGNTSRGIFEPLPRLGSIVAPLVVLCFLLLTLGTKIVDAQEKITPEDVFDGWFTSKSYNVLVDVRTKEEWDEGHIEGATFVENLASTGSPHPALTGCEDCSMIIYCRSGNRAGVAIDKLIAAGFSGKLVNGLGVSQYTEAGFTLVNTAESAVPNCKTNSGICQMEDEASNEDPVVPIEAETESDDSSANIKTSTVALMFGVVGSCFFI